VDAILQRDESECDKVRKAAGLAGGATFLEIMRAKVTSDAFRGSRDDATDLFRQKQLVGNLVLVFLAGTDTTATVLSWVCYHLARDQVIQAECAAEALSFDLDAAAEPELMAKLPTLESLYWEITRVKGSAAMLFFEAAEGQIVTIRGRTIRPPSEEGPVTITAMLTYANRTKEAGAHAGIDAPEAFLPRRWKQADGTVRQPPADAFFSFGHGMRTCPGRELSSLETVVVVAYLLGTFVLRMPEDHPEVLPWSKATERPNREINLLLTPR
jgi:cytochrome P450